MSINWSQAPDWAKYWCITKSGQAWWLEMRWELNRERGGWSAYGEYVQYGRSEKAESFNYDGHWQDSMTTRQSQILN